MKTQSDIQIQPIQHLGNGYFYVHFLIREIETEDGIKYEAETVKLKGYPTKDMVYQAVIHSRYTDSDIADILADQAIQRNADRYVQYLGWREIAKAVSEEITGYDDLKAIADQQKYVVTLPFSDTLSGGKYQELADRMLKLKVPYQVDTENNKVTVYLSTIYPGDAQVLGQDQNVVFATILNYQI